MISITDKISLINLSFYAEKVGNECKFYQLLKPLNKTTYWITVHGSLYGNWIDTTSQNEPEYLILDVQSSVLKDDLLESDIDGTTVASSLGLNVDENSSNFDIINQVEGGKVLLMK